MNFEIVKNILMFIHPPTFSGQSKALVNGQDIQNLVHLRIIRFRK